MDSEIERRIRERVMAYAEQLAFERAHLLYYRAIHQQDRIDRGNKLPEWDWPNLDLDEEPKSERRPRKKRYS